MNIIAKLWATQVKNSSKTFADVPRLLKEQVRQILVSEGREDLIK